jgi:sugar phosphate isomerase/epimerase
MAFTADRLGIQSWSFREFKERPRLIAKLKECGLSRLELCGVHADFANPEGFSRDVAELKSAGIAIDCIGVQWFGDDEAKSRGWFELAKRAGVRVISADFPFDPGLKPFHAASKLADEYGIPLAIHNHGGRHWLGNAQTLDAIFANTSERIGLCLDTAWAIDAGEDPVALASRYAKRLYAVHIKDFTFDRVGKETDVVVGTGTLDLPALAKALDAAPDLRSCALEYEGEPENPSPAIIKCVAAVRAVAPAKGASRA